MSEVTGIVIDGLAHDGYEVVLDDDRSLIVNVTAEGIIMDVWGPHTAGTEAWTNNETGIDASHLGTVGMMFDEWADWVIGREDEVTA